MHSSRTQGAQNKARETVIKNAAGKQCEYASPVLTCTVSTRGDTSHTHALMHGGTGNG